MSEVDAGPESVSLQISGLFVPAFLISGNLQYFYPVKENS